MNRLGCFFLVLLWSGGGGRCFALSSQTPFGDIAAASPSHFSDDVKFLVVECTVIGDYERLFPEATIPTTVNGEYSNREWSLITDKSAKQDPLLPRRVKITKPDDDDNNYTALLRLKLRLDHVTTLPQLDVSLPIFNPYIVYILSIATGIVWGDERDDSSGADSLISHIEWAGQVFPDKSSVVPTWTWTWWNGTERTTARWIRGLSTYISDPYCWANHGVNDWAFGS